MGDDNIMDGMDPNLHRLSRLEYPKIYRCAKLKDKTGKTYFKCECGKLFANKNDLGIHLQYHHGVEPKYYIGEKSWKKLNPSRRDM